MSGASRPRVYLTRDISPSALQLLESRCDVTTWDSPTVVVPRDVLIRNIAGVDGLLCRVQDKVDAELIDAAGGSLRAVSTYSVGTDHIDLTECARRGVVVGHTAGVLTDATAELTVALLLATARRLAEGMAAVRSGDWPACAAHLWLCGSGLTGSTVGVVGLGRIGAAVARRLRPFGIARLLYCGRHEAPSAGDLGAERVHFDILLRDSDFVVVCCALTAQTAGMFDAAAFARMRRSAVFVNASRGGVVAQDDLVAALRRGDIAAAGLDVTTPEPLPPAHALLSLANCVVLPHLGSATGAVRLRMCEMAVDNLLAALAGTQMPARVTA